MTTIDMAKPKTTRKRGRPTACTEQIAGEICRRLAGGESLISICRDDDMPARSSVMLWIVDGKHPDFSDKYRDAREAAGYSHADEMAEMRHKVLSGELEPQTAKVVADMLKWSAERMAPRSHGPRVQQEHSGPGGQPLPAAINVVFRDPDEQ